MRIKLFAKDLKPKTIAYLPFYGRLLRAKVEAVHPYKTRKGVPRVAVLYDVLSASFVSKGLGRSRCDMNPTSVYEVYRRPR